MRTKSLWPPMHHIPLLAAQFTIQSTRICELETMMNSARKEDTFVYKGIRLRELSLSILNPNSQPLSNPPQHTCFMKIYFTFEAKQLQGIQPNKVYLFLPIHLKTTSLFYAVLCAPSFHSSNTPNCQQVLQIACGCCTEILGSPTLCVICTTFSCNLGLGIAVS
ncbi:hypothetical protein CY35_01G184200 [Sphagnum magellanicum]|jgi:hypothetical protein|nr:hypothetical protein CY35_01G184200 [Sphagnum magellanicum]